MNDVIAVNDVNEYINDLMIGTIILRGREKCHVLSGSLMLLFVGQALDGLAWT